MLKNNFRRGLLAMALASTLGASAVQAAPALQFQQVWTQAGQGSEIVAIDMASGRVFNTYGGGVEVRDVNDGGLIDTIAVPGAGGVQSVAVKNGIVAIAASAPTKTDAGFVAFYDSSTLGSLGTVGVGALPDMVTFSPDGNTVLVANEGEPNDAYTIDPVGSVTVIDISGGIGGASATHLGFGGFAKAAIEAEGGRIFGPGASVSQDIEPEYITVSPDGNTAFVTLQENNAVAKIDLSGAVPAITDVQGLGFKDHSLPGNELDASNDDGIDGNLQNWNVLGMYQPDSIDSYEVGGQMYYVTANEGDARDYAGYSEEKRVKDLDLDLDDNDAVDSDANDTDPLGGGGEPADGNFTLQDNDQLGRLKTTSANGEGADGDGLYEQVYSYGARSISIWDENGNLVADTGSMIEKMVLAEGQWQEGRSDDKGPEPEALKLIELDGWVYALVGLERTDGFMVFNITDPTDPQYMDYIYNGIDEAPEGLDFALMQPTQAGSTDWGWLAVANEDTNTTTWYRVTQVPVAPPLALLGLGLLGMRRMRRMRKN